MNVNYAEKSFALISIKSSGTTDETKAEMVDISNLNVGERTWS